MKECTLLLSSSALLSAMCTMHYISTVCTIASAPQYRIVPAQQIRNTSTHVKDTKMTKAFKNFCHR